jgi:hypothetical protein
MAVVKALWDSWAEDAVIEDRDRSRYAKPERIRPINHKGEYYQVAGPAQSAAHAARPAGIRASWRHPASSPLALTDHPLFSGPCGTRQSGQKDGVSAAPHDGRGPAAVVFPMSCSHGR